MVDRIALLHNGRVQVGSPRELYERPANAFVAGFIGETNLLPVPISHSDGEAVLAQLAETTEQIRVRRSDCLGSGTAGLLGVRPEHIEFTNSGPGLPGVVVERAYAGSETTIHVAVKGTMLTVRSDGSVDMPAGSQCMVRICPDKFRIYPAPDA